MKLCSCVLVFVLSLVGTRLVADSVTLNSGERIEGRIVSQTSSNLAIEVTNASRSIFSTKIFSKTDIKAVQAATPEELKELADYDLLKSYRLSPDQAAPSNTCSEAISEFESFLQKYPQSKFADEIQKNKSRWKDELNHIQLGDVKVGGQWMSATKGNVAAASNYLKALTKWLNDLALQRDQAASTLLLSQQQAKSTQARLQSTPAMQRAEPIYENRYVPDSYSCCYKFADTGCWCRGPNGIPYWHPYQTRQVIVGYKNKSNPEMQTLVDQLAKHQSAAAQAQQSIAALDRSISEAQQKIAAAQTAYNLVLAKSETLPTVPQEEFLKDHASPAATTQQVAIAQQVATNTSAQADLPAKATPDAPWYQRHWAWILGGVVALFVLSRVRFVR